MIIIIKNIIAFVCNALGISNLYFYLLGKKQNNNYVRVINYHGTGKEYLELFDRQLSYFEKKFEIIDYDTFKAFLDHKYNFSNKPGMLITFDDGFISNYEYGIDILENHKIKGLFFVSSEKNGETDPKYISHKQLKEIDEFGHSVGDHTATHYRFTEQDDEGKLKHEIIDSKYQLEKAIGKNLDSFCFVGGELPVYTENAYELIRNNYDYCFTTLTQITTKNTNKKLIHRTNVESHWKMNLVKFQISGLWDLYYKNKSFLIEEKLIKQ